tara:strand:- start:49 stop:417 length:369 start_codon:yes stop_codon:yes gene_type:complete
MARNSIRRQKKKSTTSGTTWINRNNKIIQADEGRNKKRLIKEKVGQNIKNVRRNQKSREDLRKTVGLVGDQVKTAGSNLKRSLLSIGSKFVKDKVSNKDYTTPSTKKKKKKRSNFADTSKWD